MSRVSVIPGPEPLPVLTVNLSPQSSPLRHINMEGLFFPLKPLPTLVTPPRSTSPFQVKAALASPWAREPQSGGRPLLLPSSFVHDW